MEKKMNIRFSPPDVGEAEIEEVVEAIRSGWITTGPKTKKFEQEITKLCNTDRTVCLNSSTASMEMTLRMLGIGQGDEVITSAYTYTASCSVICHVGATPVLVDINSDNFEMDYDKLESAITSKTKAIIPVDIGGVMCDYEKISKVVESKKDIFEPTSDMQKKLGKIAIIADSSHAIGAMRNGKMAGEYADFTCFSFHAVKNLTTAEGGAITWKQIEGLDNEWLYKQFMLISLHGQSKDALAKTQLGAWEYDIVSTAYKCNMTDIMASIGLAQLKRYPTLLKKRKKFIELYESLLNKNKIEIIKHYNENSSSSGHLMLTRVKGISEKQRNEIIIKLAENGISSNVHYKPLPMHTAYKELGFDIKNYPNAYNMYKNEITLPLHTLLTTTDIKYICEIYNGLINEKNI